MRIRLALSPFLLLLQLPVTERFVAVDNVCAWPNLTLAPDGTLIATIFNRPYREAAAHSGGSSSRTSRSRPGGGTRCRVPEGHSTSTDRIPSSRPRPKKTLRSLADR